MPDWKFSENKRVAKKYEIEKGMGCVYAIKLYVMPKMYLTKIGSSQLPHDRFTNLGKNGIIYCISKPHYNYIENEAILHRIFEKYRLPRSPNAMYEPELFNMSLSYMFNNLPILNYETELKNCIPHKFGKEGTWYSSKNKAVMLPLKNLLL